MFLLKDYLLPDPSFRNLAYRWFRNQNEAIAAKKTSQQKDLSRYKNNNIYIYRYIYIYIYVMVDQNSFIRKLPFFAKLSRTPPLSFAGPMLGNNASYEDSFITCQTTPENHGSFLDSLVNMQLPSRNPFSRKTVGD